jgi:hypothetical protein
MAPGAVPGSAEQRPPACVGLFEETGRVLWYVPERAASLLPLSARARGPVRRIASLAFLVG